MRIGFTGTRQGMSASQMTQLSLVLRWLEVPHEASEFHHGGAVGADSEADTIAFANDCIVTVHPCPGVEADHDYGDEDDDPVLGHARFNGHLVAWKNVLPPLVRNRRIVEAVEILIAAPRADKEETRSGTWATVRHARYVGMPVVMLSRGE